MYRPPPPPHNDRPGGSGRGGGGGFRPPVYPFQNHSFVLPGSLPSHVNLSNTLQNPFQNRTLPQPALPYLQNPIFLQQNPSYNRHAVIQKIDAAARKAHQDLVAAGQSVSAWKVSQAALLALNIEAWSSLGFQIQDVPSLHSLIIREGKVNAFIHCFLGARRITSLYDMEVAICKNEGVELFEELKLGPLLRHPLIEHYFSVPSDMTEILKITTDEIIGLLQSFMEKQKKMIKVEDFLDFLTQQKSVPSKEKLGVRIQSLGLHVSYIREAKKEEKIIIGNCLARVKKDIPQIRNEYPSKPSDMILQKKSLERRFSLLSKRVQTFASEYEDFDGKHIHFESSASDEVSDDGNDDISNDHVFKDSVESRSRHNKDNGKHVSSCPYPSTTEEMVRLGLKNEASEKSIPGGSISTQRRKKCHDKKRKFEEKTHDSPFKLLKKDVMTCKGEGIQSFLPTNVDMEKFITTWKEACREHCFAEVLDMMLNFYGATVKQKKRAKRIMLSYPGIGLMVVAITSIKHGLVDSLYDTFQAFGESEFSIPQSAFSAKMIDIGPANKENTISNAADELKKSVTAEDIISKVVEYSELENFRDIVSPSEKLLWSLKKFHSCEKWLATSFSVKEFSSLGYGHLFEFLEKYSSMLPHEIYQIFNGGSSDPSPMHVSLCEKQLHVLLSLANYNWMEEGVRSKNDAFVLLKKQFPTTSFIIVGDEFEQYLSDVRRCQKANDGSDSVLFSAAMLGKQWSSLEHYKRYSPNGTDSVDQQVCTFETSVFKNAIDCLLAAPMLSDLLSWSHWDIVYAPSFGPLIDWLLTEAHNKELLCIATRGGKLIKVDPSATVDDFLEALIQLSSFQVALKLLSLLPLYRGTSHAPLSLLKCYAQQAMDVIIRNFIDSSEIKITKANIIHMISNEDFNLSPSSGDFQRASQCRPESMFGENISKANKAFATIARFILECLGLLPSEFWSFVADILVSGLRSFTRQAPLFILKECNQPDQRFMLHDIGLSLGVNEWVQDYHEFSSRAAMNLMKLKPTSYSLCTESGIGRKHKPDLYVESSIDSDDFHDKESSIDSDDFHDNLSDDNPNQRNELFSEVKDKKNDGLKNACRKALNDSINMETLVAVGNEKMNMLDNSKILDATLVVEAIRREEFGLDRNLADNESRLLKKQHARLGRALHCLSQELYSQDSHLLLELVQNADDNVYSHSVEPTLCFILQETGIVVLNNEVGFSADNIRALCDIGNSTKKRSSAGYIGHKGIGFKSVFRVTDAPEIHSNGFHVKFDITEGQIGFILPTNISPCDSDKFIELLSEQDLKADLTSWNTCIILPFRSKLVKETTMTSIISMFSDLHPSLLLFLHRLRCIRFKNMLNNTSLVLRRETAGDGIVKVSHGNETMSWLVVSKKLQAGAIRQGVQTTEIAVAFTLLDTEHGEYRPVLSQQPAFAFLPLRNYGLKFILQGDFILPSSREEVDGDSAWNQWLLSEFPALFVNAEQSFCSLLCYHENPAKAVTAYMSFVPLAGEVHGFFAHLPHMIISKLRMSTCLLLDEPSSDWVLPCRTLRGWDEQVRTILPDRLLQIHLGLGYLNKDIILSDTLAKALGVVDYGPKVLIDFISSLCHSRDGIKSLGLDWLASWFIILHSTLLFPPVSFVNHQTEPDLINTLRKLPFIPLTDGSYGSISDGPIWLPCDICSDGFEGKQYQDYFPRLCDKLRTVNSLLFTTPTMMANYLEEKKIENLIQMLCRIGVQQLSAHEIIKNHILVAFSDEQEITKVENSSWMIEYLSFTMVHLQFPCANCLSEKGDIITKLRKKSIFLTNDGYKCPDNEPIHFSREYGNSVDIDKLIGELDIQWLEVDVAYLKHPSSHMLSSALKSWRGFFEEFGVTDFVQVNCVRKHATDVLLGRDTVSDDEFMMESSVVNDWESPELDNIISTFSLKKCRDRCIYLLEILDKMWDNCYSAKARMSGCRKSIKSSFMNNIRKIGWIASTMDLELHKSEHLFYYCEELQSVLGNMAPYAVPQLTSKLLLIEIGFKTQLSYGDACTILHYWRTSKAPFVASATQMSKFYSFISGEVAASRVNITREFISSSFIFVPFVNTFTSSDSTSGTFLSPKDVCWIDPTGCIDKIKEMHQSIQQKNSDPNPCKALSSVYPGLCDFFIQVCHVREVPSFGTYLQILLQVSSVALPSQAAPAVFRVFLRWSDDLKSGLVKPEEIFDLKNNLHKLESTVLPTVLDKWVSLHPSFGLICWVDDEDLKQQFKHSNGVGFLHFGKLNNDEKEMLSGKVAILLQKLGVPALSQVVSREAIVYGAGDNREKISLINWVLPYAQRYIYKLHQDKYLQLKLLGLEKLSHLRVLVVEELFYKHSLKGCDTTSKKRFKCSCLLQDNVLYTTTASDPHSIFLELSRFFFGGSTEIHFASFLYSLHMITATARPGSEMEQAESFVVNSTIPPLPDEEPIWSLSAMVEELVLKNFQPTLAPCSNVEQNTSISKKKPGIPSWPPTDWKTAPDFSCGRKYSVQPGKGSESYGGDAIGNSPEARKQLEVLPDPIEVDDWIVEEDLASKDTLVLQDSGITNDEPRSLDHCNALNDQVILAFGNKSESADPSVLSGPNLRLTNSSTSVERDTICLQIHDDTESRRIGRLGEIIAYRYLTKTLGPNMVKWVNEQTETGEPYDLIIGDQEYEYVEVKTTRYASRNWFEISTREWQRASELGDSFSIAHVALSGDKKASITIFKNPLRLCNQRTLRLALFMSRQIINSSVTA